MKILQWLRRWIDLEKRVTQLEKEHKFDQALERIIGTEEEDLLDLPEGEVTLGSEVEATELEEDHETVEEREWRAEERSSHRRRREE